jgi:hypothetical protein
METLGAVRKQIVNVVREVLGQFLLGLQLLNLSLTSV